MLGDGMTNGRSQAGACSSLAIPATGRICRSPWRRARPRRATRRSRRASARDARAPARGRRRSTARATRAVPRSTPRRRRWGWAGRGRGPATGAGARPHGQDRGPDEGVVARPDVLQVDDERIDPREVLGLRRQVLEGRAVEAADRVPRASRASSTPIMSCASPPYLCSGPKTMATSAPRSSSTWRAWRSLRSTEAGCPRRPTRADRRVAPSFE